jgi:GTP cyclohydrolase I
MTALPSATRVQMLATGTAEEAVRVLLDVVGETDREGLRDTPRRVVRTLMELTAGYDVDVDKLLQTTFDMDRNLDQLVVVTGIRLVSLCEHHMLPFTGSAVVGYIPAGGRVVGLSKIPRLVDAYARRLQVQERLTEQIADKLAERLQPVGVGVVIRAHHACMGIRGAQQPTAMMTTSALRGALLDKPAARAEFMALAQNGHLA